MTHNELIGFYGQTNKWTHDHSIAHVKNGKLTYAQLERITRKKFDNRLPEFLEFFLKGFNVDLNNNDDLDIGYANTFALDNNFFERPSNKIESQTKYVYVNPKNEKELKVINTQGKLNGKYLDFTIVPHELAHIYSVIPFYGPFKDNSLLIHVDGAASVCNASAWLYKNNRLVLLEKTDSFHHALMNFSYVFLTNFKAVISLVESR